MHEVGLELIWKRREREGKKRKDTESVTQAWMAWGTNRERCLTLHEEEEKERSLFLSLSSSSIFKSPFLGDPASSSYSKRWRVFIFQEKGTE